MFRSRVLPFLIWCLYFPLKLSWRFEIHEPDDLKRALAQNKMLVFSHWHGDELGILFVANRYRASAITSTSKDGEIINGFLNLIGVKTARGSSTRGGVSALKGILRLAKEGYRQSFAVDGPKGPYHKVKPGALEVAKLLNCQIHPLGVACSKSFVFQKSWNKTYLPYPFARIVLFWGQPLLEIPRDADVLASGRREELEFALLDAGQKARNLIAAK